MVGVRLDFQPMWFYRTYTVVTLTLPPEDPFGGDHRDLLQVFLTLTLKNLLEASGLLHCERQREKIFN